MASGIEYYPTQADAVAGTASLGTTTSYVVGTVDTGSITGYAAWAVDATNSTGTSTGAYLNGDSLTSAEGLYRLYPLGIIYYPTEADATANTGKLSFTGSYTVGTVDDATDITSYTGWAVETSSTGSSRGAYANTSTVTLGSASGLYRLYPVSVVYFATAGDAVANNNIIASSLTSYEVGAVDAGSISSFTQTQWAIYGTNGTGTTTGAYANTVTLASASGLYFLYPVSVVYFANKTDAVANNNIIATSLTSYTVGTVDTGSIAGYAAWAVDATNSTGSSTGAYLNGTDISSATGLYCVYPLGIIYYSSQANAAANTSPLTFTESYTVGTVDDSTSLTAYYGWAVDTSSTGSSRGAYPNTSAVALGSASGLYRLYPASVVYCATQTDAAANTNIISFTDSYTVATVGVYTHWTIDPTNTTGSSTGPYNTGDTTLTTDGLYFMYPIGIIYFSSNLSATNVSNPLAITDSYTIGTIDEGGNLDGFTKWAIAANSTGTSSKSGVYNAGTTLNSGGIYYLYAFVVCFKEGTQILCQVDGIEKYLPIETLKAGTLVRTSRDGYKKIELIAKGIISNPGHSERIEQRLYKCTPANYPQLKEDLYITGCHSILVDNLTDSQREKTVQHIKRIFVTDKKYRLMACIDERAEPWVSEGDYTIWHMALENENPKMNYGIYVNGGLLVETCAINFLKNRSNMVIQN